MEKLSLGVTIFQIVLVALMRLMLPEHILFLRMGPSLSIK